MKHKIAEIGLCSATTAIEIVEAYGDAIQEYWGIDSYETYDEGDGSQTEKLTSIVWDRVYLKACLDTFRYPQLRIVRAKSNVAVGMFPDHYFSKVLIDGNHSYNHVLEDIKIWKPKVMSGGILLGHDYDEPKFPGVKKAVDEIFGNKVTIESAHHIWAIRC